MFDPSLHPDTSGGARDDGAPDGLFAGAHIPVLLRETIDLLAPAPGDVAVDCTAGRGGHAAALAKAIGSGGTLVLNDADADNLSAAEARLRAQPPAPTVIALRGNFVDVPRELTARGLSASCVLADLGFSSTQVDDPERGFSFRADAPLDMRYDRSGGVSAADVVNRWSREELAQVIRDFGEEPAAWRIAGAIVDARSRGPIVTTTGLAEVVRGAAGRGRPGLDPATLTFQALRIAVNDELGALDALLESIVRGVTMLALGGRTGGGSSWLAPGCRVGIISFHSLEDRAVKRCFGELARRGLCVARGGRPTVASGQEIALNPRARSAKLRVIEIVARRPIEPTIDFG